ncbi:MAG: InlB B-repeat-containing protein [Anaeromyxobacteraceae bacterium]
MRLVVACAAAAALLGCSPRGAGRSTVPTGDPGRTPATPPGDPQGAPLTSTSVVVRRSGLGRVTSDVRGIDCGQECQEGFSGPVVLSATPEAGFRFAGWGGACSGRGACTVAPGAAPVAIVTAVFEKEMPLPEGCEVLLPNALPAPVAVPLDEPVLEGASDATESTFSSRRRPPVPRRSRAPRRGPRTARALTTAEKGVF